jgi:isoquinoline 1-oxidoreductase beta subunit
MSPVVNLSRRQFLKAGATLGGALVLGFSVPLEGLRPPEARSESEFVPNAFLRIDRDGAVTVVVPQSEMGQGILTSLPMIVAEELDADWRRVSFEQAPAEKAYYNPLFGREATGGSTSVRGFWKPLREAGATGRAMLIAAAAKTWGVEAATCRAAEGTVRHPPSGRKLTYGELAGTAAGLPVPANVPLKSPGEFTIIGRPLPRLDTPAKVKGEAVFGLDVALPGLLVAVVARCPVFGGRAVSFDDAQTRRIPGVKHVVRIDSGIAVVADSFWAADQGRRALKANWDNGPEASLSDASIERLFQAAAGQPGAVAKNEGDVERALAASARKIEAVYRVPYLAHATMEPMNCTAWVRRDKCEIWAPTQAQTASQRVGVSLTGLPEEAVFVHTTFLGGGFGRRGVTDFVSEAVQVSKAVGAPVKVIWTREDDMRHDHYRPSTYNTLSAGLDAQGWPTAWKTRIVGPSILAALGGAMGGRGMAVDPTSVEGLADLPYAIPNLRVEYAEEEPGIPVGFWRSVGSSQNTFIAESFLDEIAAGGGKDPFELRRKLLAGRPRHLGVLNLAASRAGWGKPLPKGRSQGIALAESFGTYTAEVAEVSVAGDGTVRIHRVVCAVDCGMNVNPDTIKAQMESGIVFGLTAALYGEINIVGGAVKQGNFDDYEMLRLRDMPEVEVHIVRSGEAPGGIGEPGVPPIAPAVSNAVFAATGRRVRSLPFRPAELKKT